MKFYSLSNLPTAKPTPNGNDIVKIYELSSDKIPVLVETGSYSQTELIQSFAQECDIHFIIARCQNGDISVLQKIQGVYGDFSGMPSSLPQVNDLILDAKDRFDMLPIEKKELIGSFQDFVKIVNSPDAEEKFLKILSQDKKEEMKGENVSE